MLEHASYPTCRLANITTHALMCPAYSSNHFYPETPSPRLRSDHLRSSLHAGALPGWSFQLCARRAGTRRSWTERRHTPVAYLNGAFLQREALPHRRWCIEPFTDNSGAVYLISASVSRHAREALALRRERELLVHTARPDSAHRVRSTSCGSAL